MSPTTPEQRLPADVVEGAVDRVLDRGAALAKDRVDLDPKLEAAGREALAPWAVRLVYWLEDVVRVPGTKLGVGADALIGFLLPGAGDAITGAGSVGLLAYAVKERVPTVILFRMVVNIFVDLVGGVVPIVGDAFDLLWRSNKRNLELIERYRGGQERPRAADYALVGLGVLLAILSALVPVAIIYGLPLLLGLGAWQWFG
jgi:hypothetical protein